MGLFSLFGVSAPNKKKDMDGKEIVDFTDYTVPVPIVHSNQIATEHDTFSQKLDDVQSREREEDTEAVRDIDPLNKTIQLDLSSLNQSHGGLEVVSEPQVTEPVEEKKEEPSIDILSPKTNDDKEIFKACLLTEVKRIKGTGELKTAEDVKVFCRDRMIAFQNGTFDYPLDLKMKKRKELEAQDMINELNGKPKVLTGEEAVVRKVA